VGGSANNVASAWVWWVIITSPIYFGTIIGVARPSGLIRAVERTSIWFESRYLSGAGKSGVGLAVRPMFWGVHLLHRITDPIKAAADRAGLRAMVFFYIVGLFLFLAYVTFVVIAALLIIGVALFVVGKVLSSSTESGRHGRWFEPPEKAASQPERVPELRRPPQEGHPSSIFGSRTEHCKCRHGCPTWGIITDWSCGCTVVDLQDESPPGPDCTEISRHRRYCGHSGRPYAA